MPATRLSGVTDSETPPRSADRTPAPPPTGAGATVHRSPLRSPGLLTLLGVVLTLGLVGLESPIALAIVLMDGVVAWAVLLAAGLAGGWIIRLLGLSEAPVAERVILGASLGIGALSPIVLVMGSAGWLTRGSALLMIIVLAVAGLADIALRARCRTRRPQGARGEGGEDRSTRPSTPEAEAAHPQIAASAGPAPPTSGAVAWLWLLAGPFLAIALLAASLPPGVLWEEEGFGYDILEYHLAAPRTFIEQGRVGFLPHNVYASFPQGSGMLWLLLMVLHGDPVEAAFMAVMANVALGVLFVAAAWLVGRTFSPFAGVVTGVLAATSPWITYLSGIAYAEPGMLAMGMCALAAVLRSFRHGEPAVSGSATHAVDAGGACSVGGETGARPAVATPRHIAAGLLAGFACGYKYTAVPFIVLPLIVLCLFQNRPWHRRLTGAFLVGAASLLAFSPWLIRNIAHTGNPVFPLAYSVFGAREGTWDAELEARWQHAHGPTGAARPDLPLPTLAWRHTFGDFRMGVALVLLTLIGAWAGRGRIGWGLLLVLVIQMLVWLILTHRYARFATVMLLPMLGLAACAAACATRPILARLVCVLLIVGGAWQLYRLADLYYHHTRVGAAPLNAYGQVDWFLRGEWPGTAHVGVINLLGPEARVMLIGEARTFYLRRPGEYAVVFSRHPLAEARRRLVDPEAVAEWLRRRGTTHMLIHWVEIRRLRTSYGYEPDLDDDFLADLIETGTTSAESFYYPGRQRPYATLFEVRYHE